MAKSVKVNYILNLINTGTQMLFPLITFPYTSRVVGVEGIGQVNFFSSILSYISLFTCLGIPMYALREVARVRNDMKLMSRTVCEVLLLHSLLTFLGFVAVAILCFAVPEIREDVPLFLILSLTILFTALGCDWFYSGIEDFLYITVRGLVVKVLSVVLLFLLVKSPDDLLWYGFIIVFGSLGGNIFNFFRLRKYIKWRNIDFSTLQIMRHLKPSLKMFSFGVVTSIYLQLNPVLLGFMKGAVEVGYFAAATKLTGMVAKILGCLGTVMIPRASHLIAENKMQEFKGLLQKSYDFTLAMSLPLTIGLIVCAPIIIDVFCGDEFRPATLTSQIVALNLLMVGISNVFGIQALFPLGKINIVTTCCVVGAVADIILNIILVPLFSYEGTAVAYAGAEVATTLTMYVLGRKYLPITYVRKSHFKYILGSALMGLAVWAIAFCVNTTQLVLLLIQALAGCVIYAAILILLKDELMMQMLQKINLFNHSSK